MAAAGGYYPNAHAQGLAAGMHPDTVGRQTKNLSTKAGADVDAVIQHEAELICVRSDHGLQRPNKGMERASRNNR